MLQPGKRRQKPWWQNPLVVVPLGCLFVVLIAIYNYSTPQDKLSAAISISNVTEKPDYDQIKAYVKSTAGVFGRVEKKSTVPASLWSFESTYEQIREQRITDWITKHDVKKEAVDEAVIPAGCPLQINHNYKFIFIRQLKGGSTSFMHYFGNCKVKQHKDKLHCLQDVPHDIPAEEVTRYLKEYTVFSMVRNPYTRAASSYSFLNYIIRPKWISEADFKKPECSVDWQDFCFNPRILARHCRAFPHCCGKMNLPILMMHTDPQSPCIQGEDGTWAVDFIARAEHSDEDIKAVVDLLNERRDPNLPELEKHDLKRTNVQSCDTNDHSVTKRVADKSSDDDDEDSEADPSLECDPAEKYLQYYVENDGCFQGISHYFKEDIRSLQYGQQQ